MEMNLSANEARVIGCLMEKEVTTPDQYPLSLNGLTTACNQKSNREPVMELDEITVQETVDALVAKRLLREESGFGSRVVKYKHRFCNTEFSELQLSPQEYAVVCVLLLRGPQTPGELRTRTGRLCEFGDVQQVDRVLQHLAGREGAPLVQKLPREPGKREHRFAHLFSGEIDLSALPAAAPEDAAGLEARVAELEQQLAEMQQALAALQTRLDGGR